jgi:hypothetical protein
LERTLPTLAKCGNLQHASQLLAGVSWQIQKGVNVGHGDPLWTVRNFYDLIACAHFSFLQHAKVESWSVMLYEQSWHTRLVHADANAVARYARLCYFKCRIADAISIANADLIIGQSFNSEGFSELAESKIVTAQKALPVMVGIHLVDEYGTLLAAMTGEIGLRITIDIELTHHSSSINWKFPD